MIFYEKEIEYENEISEVVKDFQAKLAKVITVSFE